MQTYHLPPENRSKPGIAIYIATTEAERTRLKRRGWRRVNAPIAYRVLGKANCLTTPNKGLWEATNGFTRWGRGTKIEHNWRHRNLLVTNLHHSEEL